MLRYSFDDLKIGYRDVYRHWHPQSEQYAGADALLTALYRGWLVAETVLSDRLLKEARSVGGKRKSAVYRFALQRGVEAVVMPVVTSPYADWLLANAPLKVFSAGYGGSPKPIAFAS